MFSSWFNLFDLSCFVYVLLLLLLLCVCRGGYIFKFGKLFLKICSDLSAQLL